MKDNEIIKSLLSRRSVRSYKEQQISDDELSTVLRVGTYAPTAMGRQDPWIVAVQNPELRAELSTMNARVMGVDFDPYYGAPTIVLVFATKGGANALQDASLVLGNMMNAAHAIGLGSCWINREIQMFDTPEGQAIMQKLKLPEELTCVGAIALGYPSKEPGEPKPRKAGYAQVVK